MSKQTDFIEGIAPIVVNEYLSREKWVLPSVCIAQAALESGWDLNADSVFGIKGEGKVLSTSEYLNNHWVEVNDSFVTYNSLAESVIGYYDFITTPPRYAGVVNNSDYENVVYNLIHTTDGLPYATAPNYIDVVISIINEYDLTKYDARYVDTINPTKSNDDIAREVIEGLWGNGDDRKNRLESAGYDYFTIQSIVNDMLSNKCISNDEIEYLAKAVIRGEYGNGEERRKLLGNNYEAVQNRVNQLMG